MIKTVRRDGTKFIVIDGFNNRICTLVMTEGHPSLDKEKYFADFVSEFISKLQTQTIEETDVKPFDMKEAVEKALNTGVEIGFSKDYGKTRERASVESAVRSKLHYDDGDVSNFLVALIDGLNSQGLISPETMSKLIGPAYYIEGE